jgi:hypothetical protein
MNENTIKSRAPKGLLANIHTSRNFCRSSDVLVTIGVKVSLLSQLLQMNVI